MKAKELRIGNKVYVNGRECVLSASDIQMIAECEKFGIEVPSCNAIKLTEEMLANCGFKFEYEKGQDRVYCKNDISIYWNRTDGYSLYVEKKQVGKSFYSMHQLQNLYLDLTGNDL